jgi:hypothetical protein
MRAKEKNPSTMIINKLPAFFLYLCAALVFIFSLVCWFFFLFFSPANVIGKFLEMTISMISRFVLWSGIIICVLAHLCEI